MKRLIAVVLAGGLGLASVPAFAQSGTSQQGQNPDGIPSQSVSDHTGLSAYDQAPPTFTNQQLLIGGLALGGLGGIIGIIASQHHNNNSVASNPVSP